MSSRRTQLQQVVESDGITRVPIVHDALSAKLADAVGFGHRHSNYRPPRS